MSEEFKVNRKDLFANNRALVYLIELLRVEQINVDGNEIRIKFQDNDVVTVIPDAQIAN